MFIEEKYLTHLLTQQWFEKTVDVLEKTRIPFVHFEGNSRITVLFKKNLQRTFPNLKHFMFHFFQFIKT